jgi:hypothetical protein
MQVIKEPMDLGTAQDKFDQGDYSTVEEFEYDGAEKTNLLLLL